MWFRRDLRLADNPALLEACQAASGVLLLFVLDPRLWKPAGPARRAYLASSLAALDRSAEADRCFLEALRLYLSVGDERGRACARFGCGAGCTAAFF